MMREYNYHIIFSTAIILNLWVVVTPSLGELKQKWVRLDKNFLPSSALKTAIEIWETSSRILDTLENHFGIVDYKEMLKTEEEAENLLKELTGITNAMSTLLETIESVGGLETKVPDKSTIDLVNNFNQKSLKNYEKIVEKGTTFIHEAEKMEEKIMHFGVPLMDDFVKYQKIMLEDLPKINAILGKVFTDLSNTPSLVEITESDDYVFNISTFERLQDYFEEIDAIEDKVDEALKLDGERNEKAAQDALLAGQLDRYNIVQNKIKPLVEANKQILDKFNVLIESQFKQISKLSKGIDRSFGEILERFNSVKTEIGKVDFELLRISTAINEYTSEANMKTLKTLYEEFLKNRTRIQSHDEL